MLRMPLMLLVGWVWVVGAGALQAQATPTAEQLERVYGQWRGALLAKDVAGWQAVTATHRQAQVRNRMVSERRAYPAAVFELPSAPPALAGLKRLQLKQAGRTVKAVYFGKVDFEVGGEPTDNLYVVSFVQEAGVWKFDSADFVSLAAMPAERIRLAGGDLSYLAETPDFTPDGTVPAVPALVGAPKYLAKVYIFSPGRDVRVVVNKVSEHRVVNHREADIVIGGARDGRNEVSWSIKDLPGATGKEAMTIRVYLLSEVQGVQPVKAFEYQVEEGQAPKPSGTLEFSVDAAMAARLAGR